MAKFVKLLPSFSDKDPDSFFREFETTVQHFQLPQEEWVWLLKPKLTSKALTVYGGIQNNTDYVSVKEAILASYAITTEGYRQSFRSLNKLSQQTFTEFATEKLTILQRWLKSAGVATFDQLVNLIALEEFKRKIPYSIMAHITEKDETDLLKAAKMADVFSLLRPGGGEKKTSFPVRSGTGVVKDDKAVDVRPKSGLVCHFCKKTGYVIQNCPDPRCKVAKRQCSPKPMASLNSVQPLPQPDPFYPFRSFGEVSLDVGRPGYPVRIIRDTAAAKSIIPKKALPGIEEKYTGDEVYLKDFHNHFSRKLAQVYLNCPLVKDSVTIGVSDEDSLPIPEATLLLANDLAGDRVFPPLVVADTPLPYNPTEDLEGERPNLFPTCAVTRAQAKKAASQHDPNRKPESRVNWPLKVPIPTILADKLPEAQKEDPTLAPLHAQAIPEEEIIHPPSFYYQDGILMRLYRPSKLADKES